MYYYVNVNPIVRQDLKAQFDIATVVYFMGSCKTDLLVFKIDKIRIEYTKVTSSSLLDINMWLFCFKFCSF